jgi:hypothetical protein
MKITIQLLKDTISKKGYKWYDDLNIIGIRTTLQVPDIFNDLICVVWKQQAMPEGLSSVDKQTWLNNNLYVGANGEQLTLDGNFGTNSKYALQQYEASVNTERLRMYTTTTDPGTYWLNHPMNSLGAAVLKPGQWENCWAIGFHKNKQDHEALVQVGKVSVYRDNDKDSTAEATNVIDTGLFGINIHGSNKVGSSAKIGKWSAGCQVFQVWLKKVEFIKICKIFKKSRNNRFTYTLIEELDF